MTSKSNNEKIHELFDSLVDALLDGEAHLMDAAETEAEYALKTIKLIALACRRGNPSQRMLDLLADHVKKLNGNDALALLGARVIGRPASNFRDQQACDLFQRLVLDADENDEHSIQPALIETYNLYFSSANRTFESDLIIETKQSDQTETSRAHQSMETVIKPMLRKAKLLPRKRPGAPKRSSFSR